MYLDTAYVAKCYLNEPDSARVRALVKGRTGLTTSALCVSELSCVLHRHVREANLSRAQAARLEKMFEDDVEAGAWTLLPLSTALLEEVARRVRALPPPIFIRSGDAIHLTAAREAGFAEVWTSDRHMLAAAASFGLQARTAP